MLEPTKGQEAQKATPAEASAGQTSTETPDVSKMSVEELRTFANTMLEAKRSANAEAQGYRSKLETLTAKQAEAEAKALAEQGKFKELYEKATLENQVLKSDMIKQSAVQSLKQEALANGIIDPDLVNLIAIDDYSKLDAKSVIAKLKTDKPAYFSAAPLKGTNFSTPQPKKADSAFGDLASMNNADYNKLYYSMKTVQERNALTAARKAAKAK